MYERFFILYKFHFIEYAFTSTGTKTDAGVFPIADAGNSNWTNTGISIWRELKPKSALRPGIRHIRPASGSKDRLSADAGTNIGIDTKASIGYRITHWQIIPDTTNTVTVLQYCQQKTFFSKYNSRNSAFSVLLKKKKTIPYFRSSNKTRIPVFEVSKFANFRPAFSIFFTNTNNPRFSKIRNPYFYYAFKVLYLRLFRIVD